MTAEKNEKYYHESLIHPALSGSTQIDNILIIGMILRKLWGILL